MSTALKGSYLKCSPFNTAEAVLTSFVTGIHNYSISSLVRFGKGVQYCEGHCVCKNDQCPCLVEFNQLLLKTLVIKI